LVSIKSTREERLSDVPTMSDYNPLSALPPSSSRKRKPAQKLIDENNVAEPVLKRQRLTLEQTPSHVPDPADAGRSDSDPPSASSSFSGPSAPATVIESTDDEGEQGMEDILTKFVPKKRSERKVLKKQGSETSTTEDEGEELGKRTES
jgi:hypothetical protein